MKDGKFSKRFPKSFQDQTTFDNDGFPIYRRRDTGVKARKGGVELDNRWVVPHNLEVLKKFQAHINVEACNQSYLIKYLFKYCNKGAVAARLGVAADTSAAIDNDINSSEGVDEIAEYIKSRYLSWCEAVWRLLGFEIHEKFPAVERLHVHLPGLNIVAVSEEDDLEEVANDLGSSKSTLSEWFVANQKFPAARQYTYYEFPKYYTWNNKEKVWEGHRRGNKIGRLRFIHPGVGDAFYLRMLLMVVKGAFNYADVRTYEGIVYNTFREACQARGLIGDDSEWASLFDEAVQWANAFQLRSIFMTVLVFCDVGNVRALFDAYWKYMADDIKYRMQRNIGNPVYVVPDNVLLSGLLRELSSMFSNNGLSMSSYDLPPPSDLTHDEGSNRLVLEELSYDRTALAAEATAMSLALNSEQRAIYDTWVLDVGEGKVSVHRKEGETEDTWISIPNDIVLLPEGDKILAVIDAVYSDFGSSFASVPYLAQRCIVCPVNTVVDEVNEIMVDRVTGESKEYRSYDQIANSIEMPSDYEMMACIPLKRVCPDHSRWKVNVRAVRFYEKFTNDQPPKLSRFEFIMLDEENVAMEATIPAKWIDEQRPKLIEGRLYTIQYFEML
ncbi:uncharacterized protein LOC120684800 [Panicum virgatum]|uniref:uncharacterized protein LOC120684800 n=1 Tax=Panicum virgatum TaxID=38727 RepID=UPI0019D5C8FB|nr:uncharacterized protein LOC120684800 [Panicum virgatum]